MKRIFFIIVTMLFINSIWGAVLSKSVKDLFPNDPNGTQEPILYSDDYLTISVNAEGNNGKVYGNGTEWRIYQANNAVVTITAEHATIKTVSFTYSASNSGVLFFEENQLNSGNTATINATSAEFGVGNYGDAFNGQVRIKSFVVVCITEKVPIGDLYYNLDGTNKTAEVTCEHCFWVDNYDGLTTANIPSSVEYKSETYNATSIGDWAFNGCKGLTSIEIPNSVTSIGYGAFDGCNDLTVTIPNRVTNIGGGAFFGCKLISITIPEGMTTIEAATFAHCTQLTTLTIPNSVTTIKGSSGLYRYGAFEGCTSLQKIYNYGQVPANVYSNTFDGVDKMRCTLYVPQNSIDMYKNAAVWRDFYYIEPLECVTAIEDVVDNKTNGENAKIIKDGQLFILRREKVYSVTGQEVR